MALTYRSIKGSALTNLELDNNFRHFTGSHSIIGSITVTGDISAATGSITGNLIVSGGLTTTNDIDVSGSVKTTANITTAGNIIATGSLTTNLGIISSGSINLSGLPVSESLASIGGVWLSGSTGVSSKYLVVRTA